MEDAMILDNSVKKTLKDGGVVLGTMLTHLRQPAVVLPPFFLSHSPGLR